MLIASNFQRQTNFSIETPAQSTLNGRSVVAIDKAYLDKQDVKAGCGPNMFDGLFKGIAVMGATCCCLCIIGAATISVGLSTKSYQSTMTAFAVTSALSIVALAAMFNTNCF